MLFLISGGKTGTGTVFITLEDVNDNLPTLPSHDLVLCEKADGLGSVVVVAEDNDEKPFSSPFLFKLIEPYEGKWTLSKLNGNDFSSNNNESD